jgi:hypothetical protein
MQSSCWQTSSRPGSCRHFHDRRYVALSLSSPAQLLVTFLEPTFYRGPAVAHVIVGWRIRWLWRTSWQTGLQFPRSSGRSLHPRASCGSISGRRRAFRMYGCSHLSCSSRWPTRTGQIANRANRNSQGIRGLGPAFRPPGGPQTSPHRRDPPLVMRANPLPRQHWLSRAGQERATFSVR